ncbi:MAG: NHL repeat-containing protein [Cecembia sp.]
MDKKEPNIALNITLKRAPAPSVSPAKEIPIIEGRSKFFLGDTESPFLAPRGVYVHGNKLLVSDTGQNRVFIWHQIPDSEQQKPDLVIGQSDLKNTGRNEGGEASAQSLQYPSAVWTDGKKLIVADAWNHRVLIWKRFPQQNHQPADIVLGQEDFQGNLPNRKGVNSDPSANSLYWPYGIAVYDDKLFVADTGNRRVLVFNQIPECSGQAADGVIGQENCESRGYDPDHAIWPYGVALGPKGELAITDTQYYRVLLWDHWKDSLNQQAICLVGQPNFESNGQNQFGLSPGPNTLNWCYFAGFYKEGLFVNDTGNSRILWFEKIPKEHGVSADALIGKPDFYTGSEFGETVFGTEKSLYWPFSFSMFPAKNQIVIADTGNHRIVLCDLQMS